MGVPELEVLNTPFNELWSLKICGVQVYHNSVPLLYAKIIAVWSSLKKLSQIETSTCSLLVTWFDSFEPITSVIVPILVRVKPMKSLSWSFFSSYRNHRRAEDQHSDQLYLSLCVFHWLKQQQTSLLQADLVQLQCQYRHLIFFS